MKVLTDNGNLIARGRLKHQYPHEGEGPADAFRLPDVPGVAVVPKTRRRKEVRAVVEKSRRASAPTRITPM
jgi:hypothetical protein